MSLAVALRGRVGALAIDAAFDVPDGVTALVGRSGAGKTTLLRAIAGLERLGGGVRLGDDAWQDGRLFVPPHRRRVGYVFQGGGLLPHLSVAGNLRYAERRAGPGHFVRDEVIARTGIAGLLDRAPARLSGGETRRVAIARAFLAQPRVLLLDEPLAGLDAEAREELLGWLAGLLPGLGLPVLYVSHDAAEVARIAGRRLAIADGKLVSPPPG